MDASIAQLASPYGKLCTVIIRDVTKMYRLQREQATHEALLCERQRRLRIAQRVARIGYWQMDLATQQMWWCDEAYRVMGADRTRFDDTYEGLLQLIHPGDRPAFVLECDAAAQAGLPLEAELRVITSCGEVRWIQLLGWVEDSGSDGIAHFRTGMVREITNRKHSERVIARQVDLLNRTGSLAKVGGWEVDMETRTSYFSEEIYRIHEIDSSIVIGREVLGSRSRRNTSCLTVG